jgi:hypothetical protein
MAAHQMFRGIRRRIRETVIATAIGAALGAACIVTVVGAAIGLMDHPTAHRGVAAKERLAVASTTDSGGTKAPAAPAVPTSSLQTTPQASSCSDKAWPPCLPVSTEKQTSSQSDAPAAASVPYLAGSISTASIPAEPDTAKPIGSTATAPAPAAQAVAPDQNKNVVNTSAARDVAPATHEQVRELPSAASDTKSRRAERDQRRAEREQRRAERDQRRLERHQYRSARVRVERPERAAQPQTAVNSSAGDTPATPAATEQPTTDTERVTSSQRYKRKARSRTQQPDAEPADAVSQDPPREPAYAERRDDGFGFFFGR